LKTLRQRRTMYVVFLIIAAVSIVADWSTGSIELENIWSALTKDFWVKISITSLLVICIIILAIRLVRVTQEIRRRRE
jgi:membrane protein DedA with SNARE-associated domain